MKQPKKNTTFYLVRHGETEWNVKGLLQGHQDSPLTKKGEQQAHELSVMLSTIHFDAVYSSDLHRAQHTAQILASGRKVKHFSHPALREFNFGKYEGRPWAEMDAEFHDLIAVREQMKKEERFHYHIRKDSESDADGVGRVFGYLQEITAAQHMGNFLVITHGGILRSVLISLGYEYHELSHSSIKNLSYIVVEYNGMEFVLKDTYGIEKQVSSK